ncbi:MAG: hypothetical protein R3E32_04070 [Chitinophagales bacterium]
MAKLKSEGKCLYCDKVASKAGISKHLETHLKKMEVTPKEGRQYFHIRVEADLMFLQLLISGDATFKKLDSYLRKIWLECCGHMSQFGGWGNKIGMSKKVKDYFYQGFKTDYQYDFGSTTGLTIKVIEEHYLSEKQDIVLISRNEPLEIYCHTCGKKPATQICTVHLGEGESFFCEDCVKKHEKECEDAEYALMPVVNSPRMGVCGYMGGSIDEKRDGVFEVSK